MYYLSFKDLCLYLLKAIVIILTIIGIGMLFYHNYGLGIAYCNYMNIPKDFTLSLFGLGMALEVAIVLSVIELLLFVFILKQLKKININCN